MRVQNKHLVGRIGALQPPAIENRLLAVLPTKELAALSTHLEYVFLEAGEIVYEAGQRRTYLYFPAGCILALVYTTREGVSGEVALVGREGVIGITSFMGGVTTPRKVVVQCAGGAFRLKGDVGEKLFHDGGTFQVLLLRYVQALIAQIAQTAICNRAHTIEQQLCRWLLLLDDGTGKHEFVMTQEVIASMLGVRREGIARAEMALHKAGLIDHSRGRIKIIAREGLEKTSCECYSVVKKEFKRLLR